MDCAYFYQNEMEIGHAIREKLNDGTVKREDLFITTKVNYVRKANRNCAKYLCILYLTLIFFSI